MRARIRETLCVVAVVLWLSPAVARQTTTPLPEQLSDEVFWSLIRDMSEPGGAFTSENFVSNERSYQQVIDPLVAERQPASAYVGVGPEQNFTYIAALEPRIAFIVDIRRQNMVQHLMYKALFELSADRADFLSRLLSRPRPDGLGAQSTIDEMLDAFGPVVTEPVRLRETVRAVTDTLVERHHFALTASDRSAIDRILTMFSFAGPNLTYSGPVPSPLGIFPTFDEMMRQTDNAGRHRGFLASEDAFVTVQTLERRNLVVPIVGDFAGPTALRAVGRYLRDHEATVTAFYTSNVEQYLFLNNVWRGFYENVASLPVTERSVIVRCMIRLASGEMSPSPAMAATSTYASGLAPIPDLILRFRARRFDRYVDMLGP